VAERVVDALRWRCIGPFRGGRVVAVAGDPVDPATFYFGACAGGVWKTEDAGTYWRNITDGQLRTAAVGAIAVAESDPSVLYAGMGESTIRGDVSHGDGVYRSTDRGRTWTHCGLADTRHIGRVRVHPRDPDVAYVAALGHAFGPNAERGVFRTRDGGRRWERVLFRSERAGAVDLSLDPGNPRVLYASLWQVLRTPWALTSGGPDSGLYKSADGGDTWVEMSGRPGFPGGLKGKIGVAVSPARPDRVWTMVEAEDGGLFRSDDAGATWMRMNADRSLRLRPWYYCHVVADPQDADTVYVLNVKAWKSVDGGRSFTELTTPHGDNHDLWIDPRNPRRMIEGNDGGACVSFNAGESWSTIYNQPTAQFYHLAVDDQFPYRVCGTQQDNTAMSVPSRSYKGAILPGDCYPVGSSESGHIAVHPSNPDVVFSGAIGSAPGGGGILLRYDHRTGQTRIVTAWPEIYGGWGAGDLRYRFQWTYPLLFSRHDPRALYIAAQVVLRSLDEGESWEVLSPDLTRNDPAKLGPSGGPITRDTTGAEHYCTIFALAEAPHEAGVFWAGTDDGLVHLSRDGGRTWTAVTPPDLPEWATVATIEPSPHEPATAYVAAFRYKLDDTRPYLYRTRDYGATWERIIRGIPEDDFTRVIRADPVRPGLLYAGTETGVYVSLDDGASWESLCSNLPVVPIYDLCVKDTDLVAATHGRSFWILDDLAPLRDPAADGAGRPVHVFAPRAAYRVKPPIWYGRPSGPGKNYMLALGYAATFIDLNGNAGETVRTLLDAGENPPDGVTVVYRLAEDARGEVVIEFFDADGRSIRRFSSDGGNAGARRPATSAGVHRLVWNLRYPDARGVPGDKSTERSLAGPVAPPGVYGVEVSAGGQRAATTFEVRADPGLDVTQADIEAQFALLLRIRDKLSETHDAINQMRSVQRQVEEWVRRAAGHPQAAAVEAAARRVTEPLAVIELELIERRVEADGDMIHFPVRLNARLAALTSAVAMAEARPTRQAVEVFDDLSARIDRQLERWRTLLAGPVAAFRDSVRAAGIPEVAPGA
jgi:photosystem II stability/assembly factor-like uncharacterized protein